MFFTEKFKKIYSKRIRKFKHLVCKINHERINKFRSILQHDIKTPIIAQERSLELLLNGKFGELLPGQKEIIQEILNSNLFLYNVVLNTMFLLDYENKKPKLKLEKINIVDEVLDACETMKHFALAKGQHIIVENSEKQINLVADKELVKKIILNILTSSVSYANEDSDILVSVKEANNSVSFSAKNKSVYMTKEKIKSLIEDKESLSDFNQLGMNLNLNIANKLIEAHNWNMVAESSKDNSSEFGFAYGKILR